MRHRAGGERLFMVGPSPYKRYSFAELRAFMGPLWVRCDSCRRFRSLRIHGPSGIGTTGQRASPAAAAGAWVIAYWTAPTKRRGWSSTASRGASSSSAQMRGVRQSASYLCPTSCDGSRPDRLPLICWSALARVVRIWQSVRLPLPAHVAISFPRAMTVASLQPRSRRSSSSLRTESRYTSLHVISPIAPTIFAMSSSKKP